MSSLWPSQSSSIMEKLAKVVKIIASEIPLTLWAGKLYHFDKCLLQIASAATRKSKFKIQNSKVLVSKAFRIL